jgi:type VI secretion system protein ImpL
MERIKNFLTNWWTVTSLVVILSMLLLCVGLPIFVDFMRIWWVRLALFALILLVWGVLIVLRIRQARDASDAIADGLSTTSPAEAEGDLQRTRMAEALASLKSSSSNKRNYLYTKPWYVIIGPPGSGKTTALLNSGLRFPFSDQALKGVGGTRNLDFWFADEAALIDTAGRYTSQDSDAAVDAVAWQNFLSLLKKHRPLQPINGVIVALGVDELLRGDRLAIDAHAAAVRRRLAEVRKSLEVAAPVYVLLTKADLLAGFVEFHDDLDVEGRRAVLGHTFAFQRGKIAADQLTAAFDEVVQTIADRQVKRLAEEPDAQRRSLILGFPAQLSELRSRLIRFLDGAFVAGDEPSGVLRGFYFTSGVQEGAPIDRLLAGMADVYDQPRVAAQSAGRAYFLNRLLSEVMFPEAGLVQMDPKARRRQRSRLYAAVGAIAGFGALLTVVWGISFFNNRNLQSELLTKASAAQQLARERGTDLVQVSKSDADLEQALGVLDALRALPQGYGDRMAGGPSLLMRFGLFQSSHADKAETAYQEGLRRILLPRLLLRLEAVIGQNLNSPLAVYEPLKVYLMLGGQKPGAIDAAAVRNWVAADWAGAAYPGADRADMRKRLGTHLDALLEDGDTASVWPGRRAPLDGTLVASARAAVQTMSVADRAYAILRQKAGTSGGAPWTSATVLSSGDAQAFANGPNVISLQVPYFFTRAGFEKGYQSGLLTVQHDLENDLWVLGGDADTVMIREQIGGVRPGVAALYAREYIAAWDGVVAAMKPGAYFQNLAAYGSFTKTPSPFKVLLLEVRKNTTFEGGTGTAETMLASKMKSKLGSAAALVPTSGTSIDAGREITSHFKPLLDYIGDGKAPAPVDDFVNTVKTAGQAVIAAKSVGGGAGGDAVQAEMAKANAAVKASASAAPAMLQGFVSETAAGGATAQTTAVKGAVGEGYTNVVLPACKGVAQDHYPFFASSTVDAPIVDTLHVFGMGGVLDGFIHSRLMPLLETAGPVWRWKAGDPVAAALDPLSADEFSKASQIRDLLVGGVQYKISVEQFGTGVDAVEFSSGGTTYRFDALASPPRPLVWSAQSGIPEARVTFFKANQRLEEVAEQGPWAIFRLMDKSRRQNAGQNAFLATFGSGDKTVTVRVSLPTEQNPFSRGGVWTFRCPIAL